jgi:hypothetical protein
MLNPSDFKNWLKKKGETIEEWLPGAVVLSTALLLAIVFIFKIASDNVQRSRGIAGFVEISDSDSDSKDENKIDSSGVSTSGKKLRSIREVEKSLSETRQQFAFAVENGPNKNEIQSRTGIPAKRARAIVLRPAKLVQRTPGREMSLPLNLFADVQPVAVLRVSSGHDVNSAIHTGHFTDDPNGKLHLTIHDGQVAGFIRYLGKEYRIVADPQLNMHYIIELQEPTGL